MEANERRKPVWKKRQRMNASVSSSKVMTKTAATRAARSSVIGKGSVWRMPPKTVPTPVIDPRR
jgi:hypothetical protein